MVKKLGNEQKFVQLLTEYLFSRKKQKFVVGDWLRTLLDDELSELSNLSEKMENNDESATDQILMLLLIVTAAEQQSNEIEIDPKLMPAMGILASVESLIRTGYIEVVEPISLLNDFVYEFTELGKKIGK